MNNLTSSYKDSILYSLIKRSHFLKIAGASTATAAVLAACSDDNPTNTSDDVNLGSGDTGILNYAYALEQLEAAFYIQVVAAGSFQTIFSAKEQSLLMDIRDHEVIHVAFFRAALGSKAIAELETDLSTIDFNSRDSILNTAKLFEDTGVAAYNGAGNLLEDNNLLVMAGKIVSVEARHAAIIRNMASPRTASFSADEIVDTQGLDAAKSPQDILSAVMPFFKMKLIGDNLPTA